MSGGCLTAPLFTLLVWHCPHAHTQAHHATDVLACTLCPDDKYQPLPMQGFCYTRHHPVAEKKQQIAQALKAKNYKLVGGSASTC
jgi:hypothetical protein